MIQFFVEIIEFVLCIYCTNSTNIMEQKLFFFVFYVLFIFFTYGIFGQKLMFFGAKFSIWLEYYKLTIKKCYILSRA